MIETLREDIWANQAVELNIGDPRFEEAVAFTDEHLQKLGVEYFFNKANNPLVDADNGMQYGFAGADQTMADNKRSIIPMPCTFGNGLWPHMFARAEAIAELHRRETGIPTQVLLTAAPSMNSKFGLTDDELRSVALGSFEPLARRHMNIITDHGYEALGGIATFSQPAAFANRLAIDAYIDFGETGNVFVGEPPHAKPRSVANQAIRFMAEGKDFKKEIKDEDIKIINEIFSGKHGKASPDFESGIWSQRHENLAIARGFGRGKLARDLRESGYLGIQSVVMHGSESHVATRASVTEAVDSANRYLDHLEDAKPVHRIEVVGANHSFGDRVGRFAAVVVASLAA